MALDMLHISEVLKDAILRDLGDEVEVIFRYGSYLKGTMHHYSDVDISYVPVHESTWKSITVLVDEVMIDLYPIHWSQLERMANFDDVRSTLLLNNQIVYARSDEVAARFQALVARLHALQQPEARPEMLRKAQGIFERTGYQYYLLCKQAANGHLLSCLQHAQNIVKTVLHALMVCNQASLDTRKMAQVLTLPKLPLNFAEMGERVTLAHTPEELLAACETLLDLTRDLLLAEQREVQRSTTSFPAVFNAAYPEFKGDLQHVLLACERQDLFSLQDKLMSVYHELMIHLAQARTGIEYSGFNSLAEYEQPLTALGFPELWPYVVAQDYAGLHQQCQAFDQHLQKFLTEHAVALNSFATFDELQKYLEG